MQPGGTPTGRCTTFSRTASRSRSTDDGGQGTETVRVIDWATRRNDFLLVSQFWVAGDM